MLLRAVFLLAGLIATAAWGSDRDIWEAEKAPADAAIAACTRIIASGNTKGDDLATTYYNRAISHRQKNDTDAALSDYNDSIRINPRYAKAYNNRGNVW